jgi:SAM-dependent methyltransferase
VAAARIRAPSCEFHCQDIRAAFPVSAEKINVVVASLSLHYFCWEETERLVERIRGVLGPAGMLLCRLNSTKDVNFGASGHPAIEENYYRVGGAPKRFFDRAAVDRLFAQGWRVRHLEEKVVHRYVRPKSLWEVVLEKSLQ